MSKLQSAGPRSAHLSVEQQEGGLSEEVCRGNPSKLIQCIEFGRDDGESRSCLLRLALEVQRPLLCATYPR